MITCSYENLAARSKVRGRFGSQRTMRYTEAQEAIAREVCSGSTHIVVDALAGVGKTATLEYSVREALENQPNLRVRATAFSKEAAQQLSRKLPRGAEAVTTHAWGLKVLSFAKLVEKVDPRLPWAEARKRLSNPIEREDYVALLGAAKNAGLVTDSRPESFSKLALEVAAGASQKVTRAVLATLEEQSKVQRRKIDMDDMVWAPVAMGLSIPKCDLLFVDEVQDYSPVQLTLALRSADRFVGVGDRNQAIFMFRGAGAENFPRMEEDLRTSALGLTSLPLYECFRCSHAVIHEAQRYTPNIRALISAPVGAVSQASLREAIRIVKPGDLFLSRTNSGVLALSAALKEANVPHNALGHNVARKAKRFVTKAACGNLDSLWSTVAKSIEDLEIKLDSEDPESDPEPGLLSHLDMLESLMEMIKASDSIEALLQQLQEFETGKLVSCAVNVSTVHRAKGLEAPSVFLYEPTFRAGQRWGNKQEERNIKYVAITRAQEKLYYVG